MLHLFNELSFSEDEAEAHNTFNNPLHCLDVEILKTGNFNHPNYGKLKFTKQTLQEIVANFEANARRVEIPVDTLHQNNEAVGWIQNLSLSGDKLKAKVLWTVKGVKALKEGAFKYISAELLPNWIDPETGKQYKNVLVGVSLTNKPFIKGLQAISLSEEQLWNGDFEDKPGEPGSGLLKLANKLTESYNLEFSEAIRVAAEKRPDLFKSYREGLI